MKPLRGLRSSLSPRPLRSNLRSNLGSTLLSALVFVLALGLSTPAGAVQPDEMLDDPVLEGRARELSQLIRCLVCQNESIDTSDAGLARELRLLVRERLSAGDGDQEVLDYLVARYGEFVLLRPRLTPANYLLWFGPAVLLLFGLMGIALYFKRRAPRPADRLTADEEARLADLIAQDRDRG